MTRKLFLLLLLGNTSLAFAKPQEVKSAKSHVELGNYMSFGIASGTGSYEISNFVGSNFCWNYTNSNKTQIKPYGHIMCNVPYGSLGTFTLTVSANGNSCVISTQKTTPYVPSEACNIPGGAVIVDEDPNHKKFMYGDWQVNLQ